MGCRCLWWWYHFICLGLMDNLCTIFITDKRWWQSIIREFVCSRYSSKTNLYTFFFSSFLFTFFSSFSIISTFMCCSWWIRNSGDFSFLSFLRYTRKIWCSFHSHLSTHKKNKPFFLVIIVSFYAYIFILWRYGSTGFLNIWKLKNKKMMSEREGKNKHFCFVCWNLWLFSFLVRSWKLMELNCVYIFHFTYQTIKTVLKCLNTKY